MSLFQQRGRFHLYASRSGAGLMPEEPLRGGAFAIIEVSIDGKAALAQPVEHLIRNEGVACSSHASGTRLRPRHRDCAHSPQANSAGYAEEAPCKDGWAWLANHCVQAFSRKTAAGRNHADSTIAARRLWRQEGQSKRLKLFRTPRAIFIRNLTACSKSQACDHRSRRSDRTCCHRFNPKALAGRRGASRPCDLAVAFQKCMRPMPAERGTKPSWRLWGAG